MSLNAKIISVCLYLGDVTPLTSVQMVQMSSDVVGVFLENLQRMMSFNLKLILSVVYFNFFNPLIEKHFIKKLTLLHINLSSKLIFQILSAKLFC